LTDPDKKIEAILRDPGTPLPVVSLVHIALSMEPSEAARWLHRLDEIFIDRLTKISRRELENQKKEKESC
jgi:hypothetical protein